MKKLLVILLALCVIFALAACGETDVQSVLESVPEAQGMIEDVQEMVDGFLSGEDGNEIVIPDSVLALSEEDEILLNGELKDGVYTNRYFGFRFTSPEDWTMKRDNDEAADPTDIIHFKDAFEEQWNCISFTSMGESYDENVSIVIVPLKDDEKGMSEEELVEKHIEDMWEINRAFGDDEGPELDSCVLAGEEHPVSRSDSETISGQKHYYSFFLPKSDFQCEIRISTYETPVEDYANCFVKLGPDGEPVVEEVHGSLLYMGHASLRITTPEGKVIYIDPYAGDYSVPADLILITHGHYDHNNPKKVTERNEGCEIITWKEALKGGAHQIFDLGYVTVETVEAGNNRNHNLKECVGYIITLSDGIKVYVSGDTSKTAQMEELAEKNIDYAFFCCDGQYNMDVEEAVECAKLVGAKINIPYHVIVKDGKYFDLKRAELFAAPNRIILEDGGELELNGVYGK